MLLHLSVIRILFFLDEPTAGLDVEGRLSLHEQIRKLKSQGKTIILASHDMAEVETLCDRIAILNNGKIVFCGTPSELTDRLGRKYFIHLKTLDGEESFETDTIEDTLISLLEECKQKHIQVLDIKVDRGTLEQRFYRNGKEGIGMKGFLYSLALQWKLDIRSKSLLVTYYIVPLIFFLLMGGIFYFRYT